MTRADYPPTSPGRPRTSSAPDMRRPPAGCTSSSSSTPSTVASPSPEPATHELARPAAALPATCRPRRSLRRQRPHRPARPSPGRPASRATSPAMAGRRAPGARARSPVGSDRGVRPRAAAAASAWRRPPAGAVPRPPRRSSGQVRVQAGRRLVRQPSSSSGADLVPVRGTSRPRRSAPCRARRPSASASRRSRRRRRGSWRGSASAPRWRGSSEGCRFRAPSGSVEQRRRHDLAVVGEDEQVGRERQDLGDRVRRTQAPGAQDGRDPDARCLLVDGGRRQPRPRPPGRGGAVTTPTRSTAGRTASRRRIGRPNPPVPRKTVRARLRGRHVRRAPAPLRRSPRTPRRRRPGRPGSARPSSRDSRCRACPRGGRARAGARATGGPCRPA